MLTLVLMVPTTVYVHLRLPRLRPLMEAITILPIVIPPIVLIIGVLKVAPGFLIASPNLLGLEYVILAMPFAYRSLDAGLRSFDAKTMVEASNSLGAGWPTTLWRVVIPNLRTAMLSATVLTVALVLGEYTMASLDNCQTFPVWIVNFEQSSGPRRGGGLAACPLCYLAPADADREPRQPQRPQARWRPGNSVLRRHPEPQPGPRESPNDHQHRGRRCGGLAPGR